ncbi:hypothetical protein NIES4075_34100 [Tolypothrix sp. NIES-4075]|uniref:hypothetical protein n=1 Tax=Tolypothrix sp. NIES-4075 TaxID=2005459 RepID=UPI000B5D03A0|nr:hypothetical protein [Tolypothrix sp. NIES-4075]GAX42409.1 hypothetical protein NIES4075_34100 [Tolypothrix sp. NIES-4075]
MNRRSLLKLSFLTTVSWFFFESSVKACVSNGVLAQLHQKLLNLPHLKNFQVIGERYLKLYPEETQLKHLIAGFSELVVIAGDSQLENDWYRWLLFKIKQDFKHRQTVQIDGWIFSKTEAQLCALATYL